MFKSGQPNPYDDIVNKTTDENLTSENWELILNLCDKVQDEGQTGANSVIAAVLKRLAHRNPNVQLYALSLAEALSKNCGIELHREIASRAFTQGLEKIITDRTTHEKVKRRALGLIAMWTSEFESDSTLGVMADCYNTLKSKNYKFEAPSEPPPPTVDDETRRREEEELQRVLEMSVRDKGGRSQWQGYSAASSSGAGGSGSGSTHPAASASGSSSTAQTSALHSQAASQAAYQSGYVPARTPSPTPRPVSPVEPVSAPSATTPTFASQGNIVTRVRALHTFEPTEAGELAFEKGDIIKVVDRGYKDWWRGQLKGRTGIFPVNYVEPLPEPTAAELAKEAEQEAAVFAQAANIEKLLTMLRALDPAKDNLADDEEIQELYRSSMALRPKIVKLIDKYSQKRADLVSMNETFVRARTIFDRMMEESLARHSGVYDPRTSYGQQPAQYGGLGNAAQDYPPQGGPQPYGWNQPGYNFPTPATPYPQGPDGAYQAAAAPQTQPTPTQPPQPFTDANPYAPQIPGYGQPYTGQPSATTGPYGPQPTSPTPYPTVQGQPQPQAEQSPVPTQQMPQQQQPQAHPLPQPQGQPQPTIQRQAGPYVFDPNGTYADPNVHAWVKYYSQGGTDPAGSVYFISIPGLTDGKSEPAPASQQSAQPQLQRSGSLQETATSPTTSSYPGFGQLPSPGEGATHTGVQPQAQSQLPQAYQDPAGSTASAGHAINGYPGVGAMSPHAPGAPVSAQWTRPQSQRQSSVSSIPSTLDSLTDRQSYQPAADPSSSPPLSMLPGHPQNQQHSPNSQQQYSSQSQPPYSPITGQFGQTPHAPSIHGAPPSQSPPIQSTDPGAQAGYAQYFDKPLPQQFAGMSVRDGSQGGNPGQQQPYPPQSVGASA